jgi:hypothetical protein
MTVKDMFQVGEIMESEDKSKKIKILDGDDCEITGKVLNKHKIILHMKRLSDESEGNVFVRLKDEHESNFEMSKKLLATKKIIGMTLNQFKNLSLDDL